MRKSRAFLIPALDGRAFGKPLKICRHWLPPLHPGGGAGLSVAGCRLQSPGERGRTAPDSGSPPGSDLVGPDSGILKQLLG